MTHHQARRFAIPFALIAPVVVVVGFLMEWIEIP